MLVMRWIIIAATKLQITIFFTQIYAAISMANDTEHWTQNKATAPCTNLPHHTASSQASYELQIMTSLLTSTYTTVCETSSPSLPLTNASPTKKNSHTYYIRPLRSKHNNLTYDTFLAPSNFFHKIIITEYRNWGKTYYKAALRRKTHQKRVQMSF